MEVRLKPKPSGFWKPRTPSFAMRMTRLPTNFKPTGCGWDQDRAFLQGSGCVCVCVCLFFCVCACVSLYLSVCPSVQSYLCVCVCPVCLSVLPYLSLWLYLSVCDCLTVCPSVRASVVAFFVCLFFLSRQCMLPVLLSALGSRAWSNLPLGETDCTLLGGGRGGCEAVACL